MKHNSDILHQPVLDHVRKDFSTLLENLTAQDALDSIRKKGIGESVIYFYITDENERLVGVLPTRRLLTIEPGEKINQFMVTKVLTIPHTATVLEASEFFSTHKYFAFPVVDDDQHVVGVVDLALFTEQAFDLAERQQMDEVFEAIGFRVSQIRDAGPARAFCIRFPWLMTTIASGTVCALLSGLYETTLAQSLVMAFFLTLVLGLGESVSIQSMAMTIQALRSTEPSLPWYLGELKREVLTALYLGCACGGVVGMIVWIWRGAVLAALVIGSSITFSLVMACILGLSIPTLLHALKLDPKIAAGPITLALTDIITLLFYFSLGAAVLTKAA